MKTFTMPRLNDMHCHFRDDQVMEAVAPFHNRYANYVLAMPNLTPPLVRTEAGAQYLDKLRYYLPDAEPKLALYLNAETEANELASILNDTGIIAGKIYPDGVTTNSDSGITSLAPLYPVFDAMQDCELVLCIHAEMPGSFVLDREEDYLEEVAQVIENFPELTVVIEHVSTEAAVRFILDYAASDCNVNGSITPHHLLLTLDDVLGDKLEPRMYCKPVAKTAADRLALQHVAFSGNAHFFLGSDSAPHVTDRKFGNCGCAGVFTAPHLPELLLEIFSRAGALRSLEAFAVHNAIAAYGLDGGIAEDGELTFANVSGYGVSKVVRSAGLDFPVFAGVEDYELHWRQVDGNKYST